MKGSDEEAASKKILHLQVSGLCDPKFYPVQRSLPLHPSEALLLGEYPVGRVHGGGLATLQCPSNVG